MGLMSHSWNYVSTETTLLTRDVIFFIYKKSQQKKKKKKKIGIFNEQLKTLNNGPCESIITVLDYAVNICEAL